MKKLFSIGFLFIFLFNTGGYYFVFWGLRNQAKDELIRNLDAQNYSEIETIELRIPVNLPYQLNEQGYERVDGEFTHQGQIYRLVKQKLEDGILHIICIPSHKEKLLANAMNDFIKISNDIPATSKQAIHLLTKLMKDYQGSFSLEVIHIAGWMRSISMEECASSIMINISGPVYTPPPQAIA